ncbi:polysaccharide biosynthesis tyrosine autokinase [Microcoleus sp. FACHB-1515]|uniref:GumC family protein n=1 Tax=Cyanophyceae TaxID=3028117 RepID=UPI00168518CF|nr:polysaccharide biosynthesis tyrosine autokinase [Microcoleus sp. FACHB-1515]MBD2090411.1 polysaccharide biosynthesis tyrosine autokinase [Microcoleus sp. FACHB-1515]
METERSTDLAIRYPRHSPEPSDPSSGDPDAPSGKSSGLLSILRTVQRNILLVAGVSTIVASTIALKATTLTPSYTGSFRLLVEPVTTEARQAQPLTVTRTDGQVPNQDAFVLDYPTQIAILTSPKLVSQIVDRVQTKYPDFNEGALLGALKVQRAVEEGTGSPTKTIEVVYGGEDEDLVRFVLEQTAEEYLRYSLEDRKTSIGEGIALIEDQLPRTQRQVNNLRSQLQALQQRYGIIDPNTQGQQLSSRVGEITNLQLQTQRDLQEQRTLYENLQRQVALSPQEAIAASALSENPTYLAILEDLQAVESELAIETSRFTEENQRVQRLRDRQANLIAQRDRVAEQIVGSAPSSSVSGFQNSVRIGLINQLVAAANQVQILEVRSQQVAQAGSQANQQLARFPAIAAEYGELRRQLDNATRRLDALQNQQDTFSIQAAQSEVPWELVKAPGEPTEIPSDSKRLIAAGVLLGLLAGVGAALLLERWRNIYYSPTEIQEALQVPVLGVVPFYRGASQPPTIAAISYSENYDDRRAAPVAFQEAFSALYASIRFLGNAPIDSLVISSAQPGDGKTTVALNLAQTVAMMGNRVLLVDANLRSPQLHNKLDVSNLKGLSDVLTSGATVESLIQKSALSDNLFVLPSGQPTPEAVRLLASNRMQNLMHKARSSYDLVIYDTPHLAGITDASFIAPYTDGILMVVSVAKTDRSMLMQAHNELRSFGLAEMGVVVNYQNRRAKSPTSYTRTHTGQAAAQARLPNPEPEHVSK